MTVVSHVQLYKKLDEYGKGYKSSVEAILNQDKKWLAARKDAEKEMEEDRSADSCSASDDSDSSEASNEEEESAEPSRRSAPQLMACLPKPSPGQKITIDNIDYRKEVHYMTQENQTADNHYLTVCATTNRVHGHHLSATTPVDGLSNMDNGSCVPNEMEQRKQRDNYIILAERTLVEYIPSLGFLKDAVVRHIPHMYSRVTSEPTD